jgi:hypothetical protein
MHLACNEGYLLCLRHAYPDDVIRFGAVAGHSANLSAAFEPADRNEFEAIEPMRIPWGFSRHNPLFGGIAARRAVNGLLSACAGRRVRLTALSGVDVNLYAEICRRWPRLSATPVHMIMHSHLSDALAFPQSHYPRS